MYVITFSDNSTFEGGNPNNSLWNKIPSKPIAKIEYWLTPYQRYTFEGYASYNHCVERVRGVNQSFEKITKVVIMGLSKNKVKQIVFTEDGCTFEVNAIKGREYSNTCTLKDGKFNGWYNPKPLAGWINGIQSENEGKLTTIFSKAI